MKRLLVSVVFAVLATVTQAQDDPQLYSVTGVGAEDVLNLRSAPSASAPVVGTLPPTATGIEVTARTATRRWGRVNTAEGVAWAALRFLAAEGRAIDNYNLPVGLRCFGTEPFWSLDNMGGTLRYTALDAPTQDFTVTIAQDTGIGNDLRRMILLSGPDGPATAYLHPAECSDGMSDRLFALSLSFMPGPDAPLLTGCCSLSR